MCSNNSRCSKSTVTTFSPDGADAWKLCTGRVCIQVLRLTDSEEQSTAVAALLQLLLLLIHTFSVLSLQLKKLRWHNKSAIDLSNANPACGHKEVRRSTGHIMVTTRYSDQRDPNRDKKLCGSTSNGTDQYQNGSSNLLTPYREQPRSTRNVVAYPRPTFSAKKRKNYGKITLQPVLINKSKILKATHCTEIRKNEIPRSMVVEALS